MVSSNFSSNNSISKMSQFSLNDSTFWLQFCFQNVLLCDYSFLLWRWGFKSLLWKYLLQPHPCALIDWAPILRPHPGFPGQWNVIPLELFDHVEKFGKSHIVWLFPMIEDSKIESTNFQTPPGISRAMKCFYWIYSTMLKNLGNRISYDCSQWLRGFKNWIDQFSRCPQCREHVWNATISGIITPRWKIREIAYPMIGPIWVEDSKTVSITFLGAPSTENTPEMLQYL